MSRFLGSINKKSRRLGFSLLENNKEFLKGKKRSYAPGQHGFSKTPKKLSNYGEHLREKQKVAFLYGLNDKQFRRFFSLAKKIQGSNTLNLIRLMESRLDNLVFRMNFASTRKLARQLVNHRHILVDGKIMNIPSAIIKVGSVIELKPKSKDLDLVKKALENNASVVPYVEVDKENKKGKYLRLLEETELNPEINETYVVEYYNRLV
ncbi:MAG: 30S ribosomal protein S4 [Mycoplasmataceae bacterium]|jgi:small subunit ribosomal protein S4|nr:30S ribosomal protein S4 [Mycoplasmataceae bacterium]